jgi:hypothetical protein
LKWVLRLEGVGEVSRPLDIGRAFHAGQEHWWTGEGSFEARLRAAHEAFAASGSNLSFEDSVLGPELLTGYAAMYGDDELRFVSLPIAERKVVLPVLHPDTGEPEPDLEYTVIFDVVGYDHDGNTVLVEHKSTASDITTIKFWSRFENSLQLPLQTLAAIDSGRAPQKLVLDAVRAPIMHRLRTTPPEKREFYKRASANGLCKVGDPKPGTRLRDETREEFAARVRESILENPGAFYARREYFFDAHSLDMARYDLWSVGQQMLDVVRRAGATPRNPEGCEKYASVCEFDAACWRGAALTDPSLYQVRSKR